MITKLSEHPLETKYGNFMLGGYSFGDKEQIVLVLRTPEISADIYLLRVQYACINATVFSATDCDCGVQIPGAINQIARSGSGVFVYFADHEALGFGLAGKLKIVAMEKSKDKSFSQVVRSIGLPSRGNDVLWTLPFILDDLGLKQPCTFISDSRAKVRICRELGVKIQNVVPTILDEADISPEALRSRHDRDSC
jgi:GTP cyclohydrolase II